MKQKNQNKFKILLNSNIKGGSLENYNEYLKQLLLEHKISADITFSLEKHQEKTFGPCFCSCKSKGLVVYLEQLEVKLDQFIDYKYLKFYSIKCYQSLESSYPGISQHEIV